LSGSEYQEATLITNVKESCFDETHNRGLSGKDGFPTHERTMRNLSPVIDPWTGNGKD
jgi:hypothetical protein